MFSKFQKMASYEHVGFSPNWSEISQRGFLATGVIWCPGNLQCTERRLHFVCGIDAVIKLWVMENGIKVVVVTTVIHLVHSLVFYLQGLETLRKHAHAIYSNISRL